jgi:hypothetical protein
MIDFAIRQILKLVRKRSRFALLVEIKDSPRGPEYLFTCRGMTAPVEIASALQREIGDRAAVIDRDRTVIPNVFHVELSEHDYRRLAVFKEALQTELEQRMAEWEELAASL